MNCKELSVEELNKVLSSTIKYDEVNKVLTFFCMLSAFTKESQFNLLFNAPSSTGKSYIPQEVAKFFPKEDVIELGYCSPTSFFHDTGQWDENRKKSVVNLERKIIIFLDQPHTDLLARLRPVLSHDKKEIEIKITDKTEKFGLRTKSVIIRGFPSVIFCTAGFKIDEQEATRFLLLSPEVTQEKIREAINEKVEKESDEQSYEKMLNDDLGRQLLMECIVSIRNENIQDIKIDSVKRVKELFFSRTPLLKSRHSKDIKRIISIIKSHALLNLWFRKRDSKSIIANEYDIEQGFKLWDEISETQELNLPPFIYELYKNVILPAWKKINNRKQNGGGTMKQGGGVATVGLQRSEIIQEYSQVYRGYLPDWQLRRDILPMLESSGLIVIEPDVNDKRRALIYPTLHFPISSPDNHRVYPTSHSPISQSDNQTYPTPQFSISSHDNQIDSPASEPEPEPGPEDNGKVQDKQDKQELLDKLIDETTRKEQAIYTPDFLRYLDGSYAKRHIENKLIRIKELSAKKDMEGLVAAVEDYIHFLEETKRKFRQGF